MLELVTETGTVAEASPRSGSWSRAGGRRSTGEPAAQGEGPTDRAAQAHVGDVNLRKYPALLDPTPDEVAFLTQAAPLTALSTSTIPATVPSQLATVTHLPLKQVYEPLAISAVGLVARLQGRPKVSAHAGEDPPAPPGRGTTATTVAVRADVPPGGRGVIGRVLTGVGTHLRPPLEASYQPYSTDCNGS